MDLTQKQIDAIRESLTPVDVEQAYRDMLDEVFSFESVGRAFAHMSPADVLLSQDPIAYHCGRHDYMDRKSRDEWVEVQDDTTEEYYWQNEVRELLDGMSDDEEE